MKKTVEKCNKCLTSTQKVVLVSLECEYASIQKEYTSDILDKFKLDLSSSKKAKNIVTAYDTAKAFKESSQSEINDIMSYGENVLKYSKESETYTENLRFLNDVQKGVNNVFNKEFRKLNAILERKTMTITNKENGVVTKSKKACNSLANTLKANNIDAFNYMFSDVFGLTVNSETFQNMRLFFASFDKNYELDTKGFKHQFMRLMTALLIKSNGYSLKNCKGALNKAFKDLLFISYDEQLTPSLSTVENLTPFISSIKDDDTFNIKCDIIRKHVNKDIIVNIKANVENFKELYNKQ